MQEPGGSVIIRVTFYKINGVLHSPVNEVTVPLVE